MAITGVSGGVPLMSFDSIAQLPEVYQRGKQERMLSDLGKALANDEINYKQAAGIAAEAGNPNLSMSLMKLGREQEAVQQFNSQIGVLFGGGQPQSAPPPQAMSVPQPQRSGPPTTLVGSNPTMLPPAATDVGVAPARPAVQPTAKTWGDEEAIKAGIYDKPSQSPQPPKPMAQMQPQQIPTVAQNPATRNIPMLIGAVANPGLPQPQRDAAKALLEHALKSSDLPEKQKNYALYRSQGGTDDFTTWDRGNSSAGATRVQVDASQRGESEFEKEFGKDQAKRWSKYITSAEAAERKLVDINIMREIHQRAGAQGAAVNVKEAIGPIATALGIEIDGLSDIQAYSGVIQRLAPQQRVEGSGSTSDVEFKGMLKALPGLMLHPAAREVGLNTMEALARDEMARGEIASRLSTKEIDRGRAERELRALPDPMKGFSQWRAANPELYRQALKGGATAPTPQQGGQQGGARNIPDTVRQNGHTYQKQPDGSYRAID